MSRFDEWYREYTHPDNFAPSLEEAYNAGMERAAEMLMHRVGNDPLLQDQTAISALVQEAKAIRKEIEK